MTLRTLKLVLSYDGTDFAGWQSQLGHRTVQDELELAIKKVTCESIRVTGSGRTDAGVHAIGQVVSFSTTSQHTPAVFQKALNAELPDDIAVHSVEEVALRFHAIRAATRKRYRYVLFDAPVRDVFELRYAWQLPFRLDLERMRSAAQLLLGTHDFRSFQGSGSHRKSGVRTVYDVSIQRPDVNRMGLIHLEIEADGFLYTMVRSIVGTLVPVGRGRKDEAWVREVLAAKDRTHAGMTAPACGLYLLWVRYD
ncbi:MAG: tRNA pseudouridine(38-40) synthase TruA [Planctomycetota bacterium]|nr:tRNA pseudouridine(38-40) synthase TruA [Planctomycetota bacterium]